MFTEDHTFEEIKGKEPIGRALGNLFPSCWISRIQEEHYGDTMAKIKEEDTMEWGQPFLSEALVESANLLEMAAEKKNFMFVPLWEKDGATAGWKDRIPDAKVCGCLPEIRLWTIWHLRIQREKLPCRRILRKWQHRKQKMLRKRDLRLFCVRAEHMRCYPCIRRESSLRSAWSATEATRRFF